MQEKIPVFCVEEAAEAPAGGSGRITQAVLKAQTANVRCSVIVMAAGAECPAESHLRGLTESLASDEYELILVAEENAGHQARRFGFDLENLTIVTAEKGSGFDRRCIRAAQEALGRYLLFVNGPVVLSGETVRRHINRLETADSKFGAPSDKNLVLVRRDFFLEFAGFGDLLGAVERMKAFYADKGVSAAEQNKLAPHIDYIYGNEFNRVSTGEYKSILADILAVTSPIHIGFGFNPARRDLLSLEILAELEGYSQEELLTESLTWVLRKV